MKKLTFLLIIGLTMFSCTSNDEENNINTENSIVGNWKLIETIVSENPTFELTECNLKTTMNFDSDNTGIINEFFNDNNSCGTNKLNFEYSLNEKKLTINYDNNITQELTYEISEKFLIYTFTNNQGNTRTNKLEREK